MIIPCNKLLMILVTFFFTCSMYLNLCLFKTLPKVASFTNYHFTLILLISCDSNFKICMCKEASNR